MLRYAALCCAISMRYAVSRRQETLGLLALSAHCQGTTSKMIDCKSKQYPLRLSCAPGPRRTQTWPARSPRLRVTSAWKSVGTGRAVRMAATGRTEVGNWPRDVTSRRQFKSRAAPRRTAGLRCSLCTAMHTGHLHQQPCLSLRTNTSTAIHFVDWPTYLAFDCFLHRGVLSKNQSQQLPPMEMTPRVLNVNFRSNCTIKANHLQSSFFLRKKKTGVEVPANINFQNSLYL